MAVRLKIARTAKELDDVFKLRYDVYVKEKGRFLKDKTDKDEHGRIVDRFDAIPDSVNIIAYDEHEAIACIRVNKDSEIGLPSELHFDFSNARSEINLQRSKNDNTMPETVIVSGGMLAVRNKWRNRRNVISAILKSSIGVMHSFGATHAFISISAEALSLYKKLGFTQIDKPEWKKSIDDTLIPMAATFDKLYEWAFGDMSSTIGNFWLDNFNGRFERILLSSGEVLFLQNDEPGDAYAIDNGWISISRIDNNDNEIVLSNLTKGELFGELAIFDNKPRSATATSLANTELIVIPRDCLLDMMKSNPEQMGRLMSYFSKRLRDMDDHAMIHIFAPQAARVQFELKKLWQSIVPENQQIRVAKLGPKQIANAAHVHVDDVLKVLEEEKLNGNLEYGEKIIRLLKEPKFINDI